MNLDIRKKLHFISNCIYEKIKQIFEDNGIDFVILKGPHIAYTLYGNPYERIWSDLDFLVKPKDFKFASNLLLKNGFRKIEFVKKRKLTYKYYYQHPFSSPLNMAIELHRYLSNLNKFPVKVENLIKRKESFKFGEIEAYGLCKEDLLLCLCIHILKSYFDVEEKHFIDIFYLIKKREINWNNFYEKVNFSKTKNGTYFIFKIIEEKYKYNFPKNLMENLKPNRIEFLFLNKMINTSKPPYNIFKNKNRYFYQMFFNLFLIDNKLRFFLVFFKYAYIRFFDILI